MKSINVNDIYGSLENQVKAVKLWEKIFKIYDSEKKK